MFCRVAAHAIQITRLSDACRDLRAELEDKAATVDSQLAELNALRCHHEAESSAQSRKVFHSILSVEASIGMTELSFSLQLAELRHASDERAEELQHRLSKQAEDAALAAQQRDSRVLQLEDEVGATESRSKYDL